MRNHARNRSVVRAAGRLAPILAALLWTAASATAPSAAGPDDGWITRAPPPEPVTTTAASPKTDKLSIGDPQLSNQGPEGVITVLAGGAGETPLDLAIDLRAALDAPGSPIVLPVAGRTGERNVADLLTTSIADFAITQTDVLSGLQSSHKLGRDLTSRIGILTKLHDAELHIVAGSGISRIEDLAGKPVNFTSPGSASAYSATRIFTSLGIEIVPVHLRAEDALNKLATGEIAATVLMTGKPARNLAQLRQTTGLTLLPIPYAESLQADYVPAALTHDDYPTLISEGERIDTVAAGVVMVGQLQTEEATPARIDKFVADFFSHLPELRAAPGHPKWRDMSIATEIPGWQRLPVATRWLQARARATQQQQPTALAVAAGEALIDPPADPILAFAQATRAAHGNPIEQQRLFKEYLARNEARRSPQSALLDR